MNSVGGGWPESVGGRCKVIGILSESKGVIGEAVNAREYQWVLGGIALVAKLNPDSIVEFMGGRGDSAGGGAGCRKVQE